MGQKVHPYGFRVGYNKDWHSHWYAKGEFATFLAEDLELKRDLKKRFAGAGVSHIDIERAAFGEQPAMRIGRQIAQLERRCAARPQRVPRHPAQIRGAGQAQGVLSGGNYSCKGNQASLATSYFQPIAEILGGSEALKE